MDALYEDPALAAFYDIENPSAASDAVCRDLARGAGRVLDLGCGTGRLAASIASAGGQVVGVDPAAAMLAIARARPGGDRVDWVAGDARRLRLPTRFELIVMTGHAFQVFLSAEDRAAVFATIAAHLAPGGRAVFDSRNPAAGEWRDWTRAATEEVIDHPDHGPCRRWNDHEFEPETAICTYSTHYAPLNSAQRFEARSRIAFPAPDEILGQLRGAGLRPLSLWGDWQRAPFTPESPEIIPLVARD